MTRSEFFDDAWSASVEVDGETAVVEVMLIGVGVAGRARLALPAGSYADALAELVAVLYADEQLLRHAVRVHLDQRPLKNPKVAANVAGVASVARIAKQPPCAGRGRR